MSNQFTDKNGHKWTINLSIGDVLRVKKVSDGKFNLLDIQHPLDVATAPIPGLQAEQQRQQYWVLHSDFHIEEFFELLWWLIEPEAQRLPWELPPAKEGERPERGVGITCEMFGQRMAGPEILAAREAFFGEWRDFFHGLQQPEKALMLEKLTSYMRLKTEAAAKQITATRAKLTTFDTKLPAEIDRILSSTSGKLEASLESIFEDTPGASSHT